jgi:nicotinamide mononucleotide (NMN) deamidase PncC
MRSVVISSGHGKYVCGASGYLDEVDEARLVVDRVAELLRGAGVPVKTFHDDTSHSVDENRATIVNYHNAQVRDLDVSVHFNAYETTSKPMGTEVLYVTQSQLASETSLAISGAAGLPNRGGKKRSDLYFLNNTEQPAILIETCFCDSSADANAYRETFEAICRAIAECVGDVSLGEQPPERPPIEPPDRPERPPIDRPEPPWAKPTLAKGSIGPYVVEVQELLFASPYDGDFGDLTDRAVKGFQRGVGLYPNGIVEDATWAHLGLLDDVEAPPGELTPEEVEAICEMAINSAIAVYNWNDRGQSPPGFIQGMAVAYGCAFDVLSWCASTFNALGMSNETAGIDTLRHVYVFLIGLGMRESSGRHCEGRDMSASNTSSDTAEAGLSGTVNAFWVPAEFSHNCQA